MFVKVGHDNIPHIYVMVMQEHHSGKSSSEVRSAFSELLMSPNEEPSRFEHHFMHMSGKKYGPSGSQAVEAVEGLMQEFDELDELSQEHPQEFYAPLLQRQYFHSRTGAVVLDHEKDYDSDDDVDETWITKQSERVRRSTVSNDHQTLLAHLCHRLVILTLTMRSCWTSSKTSRWKRRSL